MISNKLITFVEIYITCIDNLIIVKNMIFQKQLWLMYKYETRIILYVCKCEEIVARYYMEITEK